MVSLPFLPWLRTSANALAPRVPPAKRGAHHHSALARASAAAAGVVARY